MAGGMEVGSQGACCIFVRERRGKETTSNGTKEGKTSEQHTESISHVSLTKRLSVGLHDGARDNIPGF